MQLGNNEKLYVKNHMYILYDVLELLGKSGIQVNTFKCEWDYYSVSSVVFMVEQ